MISMNHHSMNLSFNSLKSLMYLVYKFKNWRLFKSNQTRFSQQCKLLNIMENYYTLCPSCGVEPHTTVHVFSCSSHSTPLTELDLWERPRLASDSLSILLFFYLPLLPPPPPELSCPPGTGGSWWTRELGAFIIIIVIMTGFDSTIHYCSRRVSSLQNPIILLL